MTDRPILFSGAMVRAILDGRKSQTRRALNPQPPADLGLVGIYAPQLTAVFGYTTPDADHKIALRYMPGDRLWVREHWRAESDYYDDLAPSEMGGEETILYAADADWSQNKTVGRHRQGMHMPRWASRLTLIVTDVRVQRLQEISEADAIAEGMSPDPVSGRYFCCMDEVGPVTSKSAITAFGWLWNGINGKRPGCHWQDNPWVVAISFDPIKQNIDQIGKEAA